MERYNIHIYFNFIMTLVIIFRSFLTQHDTYTCDYILIKQS